MLFRSESQAVRARQEPGLENHGRHHEIEANGEFLRLRLLVARQDVPAGGDECGKEGHTDRFQERSHSAIVFENCKQVAGDRRHGPFWIMNKIFPNEPCCLIQ